jgi:hypothetical protein
MLDVLRIRDTAKFPIVDFQFANRGRGAALLRGFSVSILSYAVDTTPVIEPFLSITGDSSGWNSVSGPLAINFRNNGWGPARDLQATLNPPLANLFPSKMTICGFSIESGARLEGALVLSGRDLDKEEFLRVSHSARANLREASEGRSAVEIETCELALQFCDDQSRIHRATVRANRNSLPGNFGGTLFLTESGFTWEGEFADFHLSHPSAIYYVSIEENIKGSARHYVISHKIPAGDLEHFSVMLGSSKSCKATIQLGFLVDADNEIKSDPIDVHLWNPRNAGYHGEYRDGDDLLAKQRLLAQRSKTADQESRWDEWEVSMLRQSTFPFVDANRLTLPVRFP